MMVISAKRIKILAGVSLYLIFLLLLTPEVLRQNRLADLGYTAARGVAALISITMFIAEKRKSKMIMYLCLYIAYVTLVTVVFNFSVSNIVRIIAIYADIFIICIFTEYLIKNETARFIKFLNYVLWAGLLINVATVLLLPNGVAQVANEVGVLFPYYFYDYDNSFITRYIPSIMAIYIYQTYFKKNRRGGIATVIAILLGTASVVFTGSVMSSIVMLSILLGYFIMDMIPQKLFNAKTVWIVYCGLAIFLVLGNVGLRGTSILNMLGKSTSFKKRMDMWTIAVSEIPKSFLFGKGIINSTDMKLQFGYAQLHNSFLTTLLWSGLVGILLYSLFMCSIGTKDKSNEHKQEYKFGMVLFMATLIGCLFDGIELQMYIYIFFMILGNYSSVMKLESLPAPKGKRSIRVVL